MATNIANQENKLATHQRENLQDKDRLGPSYTAEGRLQYEDTVVDEALGKLSPYSRWRILIYAVICLAVNIPGTWLMLSIVFIGGQPDGYECLTPTPASDPHNTTYAQLPDSHHPDRDDRNKIVPHGQGNTISQCGVDHNQTGCPHGYVYYTTTGPTIVTDWDLVCERGHLAEMSQVSVGVGVMVGALVFPTLSDRYGRWPIHMLCQIAAVVFGVGLAFSDSITTFIVLRFFLGAFREGLGLSGIVMACELFPTRLRTVAGIALQFFWSAAWMILALCAWLVAQWRHLQLTLTLLSVLPVVAVWFAPESITWLVAKGEMTKAETILQKASKFDGNRNEVKFFPSASLDVDNTKDSQTVEMGNQKATAAPHHRLVRKGGDEASSYTLFSIRKSKWMGLYAACMCLLWFINIVVYYGLSLGTSLIPGGNRYLFFFLSGLIEIPAYGFALILTKKFGRRSPLVLFHIIAAVGLFGMLAEKGGIIEAAMSMLGKFGITASLAILVLYANEIFPTTLRNAGFGLASTVGRLGGILAPMTVYWAKSDHTMPVLVFGILAMIAVAVGIILPETAGRPLPHTLEEVEAWQTGCADFGQRARAACSCAGNKK